MNEKGEILKGNSLNHIPFSYGCIYESRNHLLFKIFMFNRMEVCSGAVFFGDIGVVEYEKDYYRNKINGYRRLYDKKNELIYEGEWLNDNPLDSFWIWRSNNRKMVEK